MTDQWSEQERLDAWLDAIGTIESISEMNTEGGFVLRTNTPDMRLMNQCLMLLIGTMFGYIAQGRLQGFQGVREFLGAARDAGPPPIRAE